MKKILLTQVNGLYFDFQLTAVRSFLRYNDGWRIIFGDIGLNAEQAETLRRYGEVRQYMPYYCRRRFVQPMARLLMMIEYGEQADVLLQIDADTLTFDSIMPLVNEFMASEADISWREIMIMREFLNPKYLKMGDELLTGFFPAYLSWKDKPGFQAGVTLIRQGIARELAMGALNVFVCSSGMMRWSDQPALSIYVYENDLQVHAMPEHYNLTTQAENIGADMRAEVNGTNAVIAHIFAKKEQEGRLVFRDPIIAEFYHTHRAQIMAEEDPAD